jgi:general stress protein CsbA
MSITFPEGVMVSTTKTIISSAYIAVILVAIVWAPLIALHGYRSWFVVTVYAGVAIAIIGGLISHYRIARRNRKS